MTIVLFDDEAARPLCLVHSFIHSFIVHSRYIRWGHGLDQNDVSAGISKPSGEGIADLYSALRLNDR